ncbi:MAG TPA: restriction endonuclease subunit S [Sulfurospirillum sp. UBA12182]|nr:MAG TPA: restriction endonuclease subunit S [Sulfurospirillum sp. UBA12182]
MKRYERYKSSNVEWIGEIPEHWQTIKIKYSTYVKGRVGWNGLTSSEFLIDGYSYLVTGTDFKDGFVDWEKCYYIDQERYEVDPFIQLKENDLLITKDGTIGKTALVKNLDKPACLNSGIFVTRPLNGVYITPFMYWILNSFEFKKFFDFTSRGSTILHLYQNVFEDFIFAYPDIDEQKLIANYLDKKTTEIEELIADKVNLISLLEQEKELTISNAVTKGLNPNVSIKDSKVKWIGEIPEQWSLRKISHSFNTIGSGTTPLTSNSAYYTNGTIPWINTGDLNNDYLLDVNKTVSTFAVEDNSALKIYPKYSLVIAMYGATIGKIGITTFDACVNQACCVLAESDYFTLRYIYYWFIANKKYIIDLGYGGGQPNISQEIIKSLRIPCPLIEEQEQIVEYLDKKIAETNETVQIIKDEIELLKEYKETLIYEVITGKIDVRGWNETH